jgi:hypothetical protein
MGVCLYSCASTVCTDNLTHLNTNILPALPVDVHFAYAAYETCITQHT